MRDRPKMGRKINKLFAPHSVALLDLSMRSKGGPNWEQNAVFFWYEPSRLGIYLPIGKYIQNRYNNKNIYLIKK